MHAEANAHTDTPDQGGGTKAETRPLKGPQFVAIQGAEKQFNNIYAVRNISVAVGAGEMLSIIGPVGAGKSTLLKIAFGLLKPDEGRVTLYGSADLLEGRSRAGYLPERPQFHENFTGEEYLLFHARLSGQDRTAARAAAARAIEITGLGEGARRRIGTYAPEMVQRLALGVALVSVDGRPHGLLVLDELSSGLGRGSQAAAREVLTEFRRKGGAIMLSSNRITEVERACTHVAIMREGSIVLQREVDNAPRIIVLARPPQPLGSGTPAATVRQAVRALHPGAIVSGPDGEGRPLVTSLPALPDPVAQARLKAAALRTVLDARWDVTYVSVENRELESIYMEAMAPREVRPLPSRPRAVAISPETGKLPTLPASLVPDTGKLPTVPVSRISDTDKLPNLPATPAPIPEPPGRNGLHAESPHVTAEEPAAQVDLDSAAGDETEQAPLLPAEEPSAPPTAAYVPPWLAREEPAAPERANRGWWE